MKDKCSDLAQVILFMIVILGGMFGILLMPEKKFSQNENRMLATHPQYSLKKITNGEWMQEWDAYLMDQFPFRDGFVGIKSLCERLSGKTENNEVYFGKKDTLIKRFYQPDQNLVENNISSVNSLAEQADAEVYFSLIPGAVSIWKDRLPNNAWNDDQTELIDRIYEKVQCKTVDNYSELWNHKEEYIFYRTDHHWTTLGAYYGYRAVTKAMELQAVPVTEYEPEVVSSQFYGTVYSASGVRWVEPDQMERYVPEQGKTVEKYVGAQSTPGIFYDYDKLSVKDKYAFFFGGSTPLLRITNDKAEGGSILVIRDSYSDSEAPFLTENYAEVWLLDLRYYKFGVQYFLQQHPVDVILINYSVSNFVEDRNLGMMAR